MISWPSSASMHGVTLMVRPMPWGAAAGWGNGASFLRQQHARVSEEFPQQHGAPGEQSAAGCKSICSVHACVTGAIQPATMATNVTSVVAAFTFLHGLSMTSIREHPIYIIPVEAADVQVQTEHSTPRSHSSRGHRRRLQESTSALRRGSGDAKRSTPAA